MIARQLGFVYALFSTWLLIGCSLTYRACAYLGHSAGLDSLEIREGIVSKSAQKIEYKKDGKTIAFIELADPVMVAMADREEEWGFFQFPNIGKAEDGTLVISWQMKADSPREYGKKTVREFTPMMSKDGGKTWMPRDKKYELKRVGNYLRLKDNSVIASYTPIPIKMSNFSSSLKPIWSKKKFNYYMADELPDELQGVYIAWHNENVSEMVHAQLRDPGLLRWSYDGVMSVVWKGYFKQLADESIVAGMYPAYYLDSLGNVSSGGVSFYQSFDAGHSWEVIGKIPFVKDGIANRRGGESFDEPAFEILSDSTFICVMRTGSRSPMYKTFSYDRGHTWTKPEAFTSNGVKPCLITLGNGVVVLSSGRPGVQVRFNLDGNGQSWTEPIDMISFMEHGFKSNRDISCGYTSMIEADANSFYLVYSDFTTKSPAGEARKSIWCRKITVKKK